MSVFELVMLICFGASWPCAIHKTYTSKTAKGKSFLFLSLLMIGYVMGVTHKLYFKFDHVIWLYALNGIMVSTDLILSVHYRRRETMTED